MRDTDRANCFICKHTIDNASHSILDCLSFKDNFALPWHGFKSKVCSSNPSDGDLIANFVDSLD